MVEEIQAFAAVDCSQLLRGCGEGCCWCQAAQGKRHPVQASMQCLFGLHGCSLAAFDLAQCRGYFNATMTISCCIDAAFCPCFWLCPGSLLVSYRPLALPAIPVLSGLQQPCVCSFRRVRVGLRGPGKVAIVTQPVLNLLHKAIAQAAASINGPIYATPQHDRALREIAGCIEGADR